MIPQDKIEFLSKESEYEQAIHYKILTHYPEKDISGNADIFFKHLDHYKPGTRPESNSLYTDSIMHGLSNNDVVAHLKFFYPNGGRFLKEFMRNGVGYLTLRKIIEDVLVHRGRVIYVFSTTDYMDNFLNKNHFEHSSLFRSQYYLYIK